MRCSATTKAGKPCRLPATQIAGGLAVCDYHVRWAWRFFSDVDNLHRGEPLWEEVKYSALRDTRKLGQPLTAGDDPAQRLS